jgi:hypothetical protein
MIDESVMEKILSLKPADRLELIGAVWDLLSRTTSLLLRPKETLSMLGWLTWNQIQTIRARGLR